MADVNVNNEMINEVTEVVNTAEEAVTEAAKGNSLLTDGLKVGAGALLGAGITLAGKKIASKVKEKRAERKAKKAAKKPKEESKVDQLCREIEESLKK